MRRAKDLVLIAIGFIAAVYALVSVFEQMIK